MILSSRGGSSRKVSHGAVPSVLPIVSGSHPIPCGSSGCESGGHNRTWKNRWVLLKNNVLYYFKSPDDTQPCGIVPLENLLVEPFLGHKKGHVFEILPAKTTPDGVIKGCKTNSKGKVVEGK